MTEQICVIIAVNLVLYFRTLRYKFVSDDFTVHKQPPPHRNRLHKLWMNFMGMRKIYANALVFARKDGKWSARRVKCEEGEHLYTLALHIVICVLIYVAFGLNHVSFLAALLYSVNPVNNQGTIWPSGRGYVYPIIGLLAAMAFPLSAPVMLTFGSSFTAGYLPPLVLIGSDDWMLLAWMPLVWLFHGRKFFTAVKTKAKSESFTEDRVIHPRKLILGVKTFGFYLLLCLIPFRITFYHNFLQSAAGSLKHKCYTFCRYFWIGLASICSLIAYAVMVPWNPLTWALFAFFITVLPFCNLWRANQEIAERFVALPNVFLMYALSQVIFIVGGAPWS